MVTVGVDTYIAANEVGCYAPDRKLYMAFLDFDEGEKDYFVRKAAIKIDSLPLTGKKKNPSQPMEFPRDYQTEVPDDVKIAQAIETLTYADSERARRQELQNQGVKSVTLGQVSESYGDGIRKGSESAFNNPEAYLLLRKYIAGSAAIV